MPDTLQKPIYVVYMFGPDCVWLREKRYKLCRTYTELNEINQLCKTQPDKFKIVEVREMPC